MKHRLTIASFAGGALCLFIGLFLIFSNGKAADLIAGYNTMDTEKKEKIDPVKISTYMGKMLVLMSGVLLLGGFVGLFYPALWLLFASWILFTGILVGGLIKANIGDPFAKD